jgi:hypothetical protein
VYAKVQLEYVQELDTQLNGPFACTTVLELQTAPHEPQLLESFVKFLQFGAATVPQFVKPGLHWHTPDPQVMLVPHGVPSAARE